MIKLFNDWRNQFLGLSLVICVFFAGCGNKPGEGSVAKRCYETLQPVMAALENYKRERQNYPQTLNELVPQYIGKIPNGSDIEQSKSQKIVFSYTSGGGNYTLSFEYVESGINTCKYYSALGKWECSGYM